MIIVNATLNGENTYDITVGGTETYRVSAFNLESAIDRVADYIERCNARNLYIDGRTFDIMLECSDYPTIELFAKAYKFTRCGTNGIYLKLTGVRGVSNNLSKSEWYKVVAKHIAENYNLDAESIVMATEDIVGRCFCYGVPTLAELPEYIAEYMNR